MGGFYIRWEKGLCMKPEILQIAMALGISNLEAAARCMMVWEWSDEQTVDGRIDGVSSDHVDLVAGKKGMAHALSKTKPAPWLLIDSTGLTFVNFERHNGQSAKKRIAAAERMRKTRKKGA